MYLSMSMMVFHPLTHLMLFSKLSVDHIAQFQIFSFLATRGHCTSTSVLVLIS
jgi:hypothetical protein